MPMVKLLCNGMVFLLAAEHVYQNKAEFTGVCASDCVLDNQAKYAVPPLQCHHQCMQAAFLSNNNAGAVFSQVL